MPAARRWWAMMDDPAVTLTDYGLALLCAVLALRSWNLASPAIRHWLSSFFAAAGAASFFGGTVHGFFIDEASLGHEVFWPATMLAIGCSAVTAWGLGARIGPFLRYRIPLTWLAVGTFPVFAVVV